MQINAIKKFVFSKINALKNNSDVIDVLNLLDNYILEIDKKISETDSDRIIKTQIQLKKASKEILSNIENLTNKGVISTKMSPYKITNLLKLIDKINGSKNNDLLKNMT